MQSFDELFEDFMSDMYLFGCGNYLTPEEREDWEPSYPEVALEQLAGVMLLIAQNVRAAGDRESAIAQLKLGRSKLDELNDLYAGALIEPEEEELINELGVALLSEKGIAEANDLLFYPEEDGTGELADVDELTGDHNLAVIDESGALLSPSELEEAIARYQAHRAEVDKR